jgi:hypothetical protein
MPFEVAHVGHEIAAPEAMRALRPATRTSATSNKSWAKAMGISSARDAGGFWRFFPSQCGLYMGTLQAKLGT